MTAHNRRSALIRSSLTRLTVDPQNPDPHVLAQAIQALRAGRLVVAPTETQYGLLAVATDSDAVERLVDAKGRSLTQPISVFLGSTDEISALGRLTPEAARLAEDFLPGPLTLVLEAVVDWPSPLVIDGKIGLRVSPSPVILQLVRLAGAPLTATSANRSGQPGSDRIDEIQAQLTDAVAVYLDAGPLHGPVSTVVACGAHGVTVLREGAVASAALNRALNRKVGG